MKKYTKTELIENVAECFNDGTAYREALKAARFSNTELADMLTIQMAKEYGYALMYLNMLHKDQFKPEQRKMWALQEELEAADEISIELRNKAENYYLVLNCIIRHGKNYHEDLI